MKVKEKKILYSSAEQLCLAVILSASIDCERAKSHESWLHTHMTDLPYVFSITEQRDYTHQKDNEEGLVNISFLLKTD